MYIDINSTHFPLGNGLQLNNEIVGEEYELVPGGSALNFSRMCASLGLHPTFIGKSGEDTVSELLQSLIIKANITPYFIKDVTRKTNISINYTSDNGETLMTVVGTANQSLTGKEVLQKVDEIHFTDGLVYFGGCFKLHNLMKEYTDLADKMKKNNNKIIIDHGRINNTVTQQHKKIIKNLIRSADYYLPSKEEFCALWETNSIEEGIKIVSQISSAVLMVKDSVNGVYGYDGYKMYHVPAYPVKPISLIGAGDSCNAGFIYAQLSGKTFVDCLRFACATAGVKISSISLPDIAKITSLIAEFPDQIPDTQTE